MCESFSCGNVPIAGGTIICAFQAADLETLIYAALYSEADVTSIIQTVSCNLQMINICVYIQSDAVISSTALS